MRYYIPIRGKTLKEEKEATPFKIPLWVWLGMLIILMLVVIALR